MSFFDRSLVDVGFFFVVFNFLSSCDSTFKGGVFFSFFPSVVFPVDVVFVVNSCGLQFFFFFFWFPVDLVYYSSSQYRLIYGVVSTRLFRLMRFSIFTVVYVYVAFPVYVVYRCF